MLGFTSLNPADGFTTPLGEREAVRIIITEHGRRVFKQSLLGSAVFGVGLMFTLNRFGSTKLRSEAAETVAKVAEAVEPSGVTR
jgi:hypothetical protein